MFYVRFPWIINWASPMTQYVKKPHATQETQEMRVLSLGREGPLKRKWQPTLAFLPGKSHGQRNLAGYSPKGRKESNTTKWLNTHTQNNRQGLMIFKKFIPSRYLLRLCTLYRQLYEKSLMKFTWVMKLPSLYTSNRHIPVGKRNDSKREHFPVEKELHRT